MNALFFGNDRAIEALLAFAISPEVLVLIAILTVILVIVFWAVAIRKPHAQSDPRLPGSSHRSSGHHSSRRRRKRRRREHRMRNPTLAETGGLPPVRGDDDIVKP